MVKQARIFVSHSSLDNEFTKKLCAELQLATQELIVDFDVLLDYEKLVSGKPWPAQLHHWMAKCHAAVLLLTKNAVRSPWVLKEATIFAWRLSLDDRFKLFTIRFPNVSDEMLTIEKFDPLSLGEVQQIAAQDTAAFVRKLRDSLETVVVTRTPFNELVDGLGDLFAKVGDNTLRGIAEKIRVEAPHWRPDVDPRQQFVEEIAGRLLCENLGGYRGIDELVDSLSATTSVETVRQILHLVASYWVDAEAAGRLPALTSCNPRRAAAMNGAKVGLYTARMYVRRAHPLSNRYRVISTAGGSAGDLLEHYTKEICKSIRSWENTAESDDAIIDDLKRRKPSFYVVIGPADQKSLDALMSRFPKLTFILWTGEALQQDERLHGVEWLTPQVNLEREDKEERDAREAEQIIRNMPQL